MSVSSCLRFQKNDGALILAMSNDFPKYFRQGDELVVENSNGRLSLSSPPEPSYFLCKTSGRLFAFAAGGSCTVAGKTDDTSDSGSWEIESLENNELLLKREEISAVWKKKVFCLRVTAGEFIWYHELEGEEDIEDIRWFRMVCDGHEYGFAGNFDEVFSTAPNFREKQWSHPCEKTVISNGSGSSENCEIHALASLPHVMALHDRRDQAALGVSVFAYPGEYLWDDFIWNPDVLLPPSDYAGDLSRAGGFAINYAGKKHVSGKWQSPQLIFTFPGKVENTLADALEFAYSRNLMPRPAKHENAPWWDEPIYCMWDDQTSLAFKDEGDFHRLTDVSPGIYATESRAETWLKKLHDHGINPGIIILDDKWQKSKLSAEPDSEKWPDLRRWIDSCHDRGIRVFLWGLAWHNEDVPPDEAITRNGEPVGGDVSNPVYEKRLREKIRRYLSAEPGCLNADGIKVDGLMALPVGRNLKNHGNLWGLELQKKFMEIIYTEAKKAKPDCCISTFAANPYLDEFTDMLRLADMFTYRLTTEDSMLQRHAVFKVTNPHVLLDTDSQLGYNTDPDYLRSLELGSKLGIPTIYNAEYLRRFRYFIKPEFRKLTEAEYRKIADIFAEYRKNGKSSR